MTAVERARILKVGKVIEAQDGQITLSTITGWEFDCHNSVPALCWRDDQFFFCGYTLDQLKEIASRPSEFV